MSKFKGFLLALLLAALVVVAAAVALWRWAEAPLQALTNSPSDAPTLELHIKPGASSRSALQSIAQTTGKNATAVQAWAQLTRVAHKLKAGNYELDPGMSLADVLELVASGRQSLRRVTFIEGWTFAQMRAALAKAPDLKPSSAEWSNAQIMQHLGRGGLHPEGRFFPETYTYAKNTPDLVILGQALKAMDVALNKAYSALPPGSVIASPDELLKLASIVEKETGAAKDRAKVSGVFHNRLRIDMRLQTDPTVIYGMGEAYRGNIRKVDLQTDTPYNTYTRKGLPPTPIAMPGAAALQAAAHPAQTDALYFVARGDGSSEFSATLDAHNRAVRKYILGQ